MRVLFEVKSGCAWADVYEGIGQLALYSEVFWPDGKFDFYRAIVLVGAPDPAAITAFERLDIDLFIAAVVDGDYRIEPSVADYLDE